MPVSQMLSQGLRAEPRACTLLNPDELGGSSSEGAHHLGGSGDTEATEAPVTCLERSVPYLQKAIRVELCPD